MTNITKYQKTCAKCKEVKPTSEMQTDKRKKGGIGSYCRKCNSQRTLSWLKNSNSKAAVDRREVANLNAENRAEETVLFTENKMKQCCKCKEVLSADCFYKRKGKFKFGLSSRCRKCLYASQKKWGEKNIEKVNAYSRNYEKLKRRKLKLEVVKAYGGFCVCCGENEPDFLSIDHIYNDGAKERKNIGSSYSLYKWLRKNDFPKDRYQLLCFNCNLAKGHFGECPHITQLKKYKQYLDK